jgi:hypothetical protein
MKKKIRELSPDERVDICKEYPIVCNDCPLLFGGDDIKCAKWRLENNGFIPVDILDREVEIE